MARSLNKVLLIGNLTRDPELRYTPAGTAVCTFGVATNRQWNTESGEKKEDTEFHRIVAWNKLAELCSQLLTKGRKVFVEGRLQTRKWQGQDGVERTTTEIVISDMVILDSRGSVASSDDFNVPEDVAADISAEPISPTVIDDTQTPVKSTASKKTLKVNEKKQDKDDAKEPASDEDIPF